MRHFYAPISGKTNDQEAENRRKDIVTAQNKATVVRKKVVGGKRKRNIENFNTNVATGGQKRTANIGE